MILKDMLARMNSFLACNIGHDRRTCNEEAHRLARMATTLEVGRHVWLVNPSNTLCMPLNIEI